MNILRHAAVLLLMMIACVGTQLKSQNYIDGWVTSWEDDLSIVLIGNTTTKFGSAATGSGSVYPYFGKKRVAIWNSVDSVMTRVVFTNVDSSGDLERVRKCLGHKGRVEDGRETWVLQHPFGEVFVIYDPKYSLLTARLHVTKS